MKTTKIGVEMLALREAISIEELKISKNQLDILTMRSPYTGAKDEMCEKYDYLARLTDTAIFYHAKWKQGKQKNEELITQNHKLINLLERAREELELAYEIKKHLSNAELALEIEEVLKKLRK